MLYAIVENLIFLLIAAVLGGVIGWLLRAPGLREELETVWRRRVEEEHEGRKRSQLQLAEAREALGEAEARAEALDKRRDEAERALQGASERATTAEQNARSLEEEKASLIAELKAAREATARAEQPAETSSAEREPAAAEAKTEAADGQTSARAAVEEIARRTAGERPAPDDDLKRIKGIGPVLERQLKAMGITSFRQIAQFTNEDIERVSNALGAFRGRVLRDNWPEGARAAHRDQYGEEA
jgi:predicted flap endonuclease-1-like 5' DNA nuclease